MINIFLHQLRNQKVQNQEKATLKKKVKIINKIAQNQFRQKNYKHLFKKKAIALNPINK